MGSVKEPLCAKEPRWFAARLWEDEAALVPPGEAALYSEGHQLMQRRKAGKERSFPYESMLNLTSEATTHLAHRHV